MTIIEVALSCEGYTPREQSILRFAIHATARLLRMAHRSPEICAALDQVRRSTPNLAVKF